MGLGEMGSYGKLAKRALETETPIMVQVLRQNRYWVFVFPFDSSVCKASDCFFGVLRWFIAKYMFW